HPSPPSPPVPAYQPSSILSFTRKRKRPAIPWWKKPNPVEKYIKLTKEESLKLSTAYHCPICQYIYENGKRCKNVAACRIGCGYFCAIHSPHYAGFTCNPEIRERTFYKEDKNTDFIKIFQIMMII
ncbi:MAG: hypothetical protein DRM99_06090, partial [Thermoplasmata archaeon]